VGYYEQELIRVGLLDPARAHGPDVDAAINRSPELARPSTPPAWTPPTPAWTPPPRPQAPYPPSIGTARASNNRNAKPSASESTHRKSKPTVPPEGQASPRLSDRDAARFRPVPQKRKPLESPKARALREAGDKFASLGRQFVIDRAPSRSSTPASPTRPPSAPSHARVSASRDEPRGVRPWIVLALAVAVALISFSAAAVFHAASSPESPGVELAAGARH
jgi:hypothetical protein